MAESYKTPGVYIEKISKFPPSVAQVETAIPAFIGYTALAQKKVANDLLRIPVRIHSFREYVAFFGGHRPQEISIRVGTDNLPCKATVANPSYYKMYYALRTHFENGGGTCYVVSVGDYTNDVALNVLGKSSSATPGGLDIIRKTDEITLIHFPDAHALEGPDFYTLYAEALEQCADLKDRFTIIDVKRDGDALTDPISYFRGRNGIGTSNLKYGAAYWPFLKTNMNWEYSNDSITFSHRGGGLLDTITLTAAIADRTTSQLITDKFITLMKEVINDVYIELSPGAFMAGIYAKVDATRGVWKAPANVSLNNVIKPVLQITNTEQEGLNVDSSGKSINCIREFTGKGTIVWGARTLAGNDNEWRYVPVRRFFNMVEESVKKSTEWVVFEPNDANTWSKVSGMIGNYLITKWKEGALAGAKPEQAFFIKVGLGETMTSLDIQEGRMIIEIGMAIVRPAEFIIFRFSHKMQES
ncbi:phage tail sheath subtilisin-like domain-containing protein [Draconibacterium sp.]|nr:phage tail sheath subtilisin-like domain-containing protein [Draconibacterium sp.]